MECTGHSCLVTVAASSRRRAIPAEVLVLGSIASVQVGAAIARHLFDDLGSSGTMLLRVGLSAFAVLVVVRPDVRRWNRTQWLATLALGGCLACMNLVFYAAMQRTPLGIAVTIEFLGPLLLSLVQTRRAVDLSWLVLAGAGVALLGLDTSSGIPVLGLMLSFLAGLFWAGYILASANLGRHVQGVDGLGPALLIATVIALPFGLPGAVHGVAANPAVLIGGAAVALLSSVIPYGFEIVALRTIPTRVFGVMMSLEPAAAAIAGLLFLHQALGLREIAAIAAISVASLGVTLGRRSEDLPAAPVD